MLTKKDYKDISRLLKVLHDAHFYETRVRLSENDIVRIMTLSALSAAEGE
jgi:hypothetical protein